MSAKSVNVLAAKLNSIPKWQHRGVAVLLSLMVAVNLFRTAFGIGYHYHFARCYETSNWNCPIGYTEMFLLPITVGLILSAFGLWLRRSIGFILSFVGIIIVLLFYWDWYESTLSIMHEDNIMYFSQISGQKQYYVALNNATLWDLAVLLVIVATFCWYIKILFDAIRLRRKDALIDIS